MYLGAGITVLVLWVSLNIFSAQALDRCLKTHRDAACTASGPLPITLECRYPGQWFQVNKTEVQTPTGNWKQEAMATAADKQCEQTKKASGKNFACEISRFAVQRPVRQVRITYFCWEFDPSLLGGFGRKRSEKIPFLAIP